MSNYAIEVKNLHKTYNKGFKSFKALDDVSFAVEKGSAFGFVGANGAGKSTAIKVMLDLIRADSGQVLINGVDSRDANSRFKVAFMPENPSLNEYLTPLEILKLGINLHNIDVPSVDTYCMEWLEKLGIAHAANKNIRQMSKGMAQRTGLAHSLACQPEVLILDEPLSGLDPIGRVDVVDLLENFCAQGGTLLFTSHVLHDVERIADGFTLIDAGQIKSTKTKQEMLLAGDKYKVVVHGDCALPSFHPDGVERMSSDVDKQNLWGTLRQIESSGCHLVSVSPVLNLERLFLDVAKH
jgi:ABC-2 type transport system ATP-binding protein